MTQADAVEQILREAKQALTSTEITKRMISKGESLKGVWKNGSPGSTPVNSVHRAVTEEINKKKEKARFRNDGGLFSLKEWLSTRDTVLGQDDETGIPRLEVSEPRLVPIKPDAPEFQSTHPDNSKAVSLTDFLAAIQNQQTLRPRLLGRIQSLSDQDFEYLVKRYLERVEGLQNVRVTPHSGDGDVDAFGERPDRSYPRRVAAQAKKWTETTVGPREIREFRGAIQGHFSEGIFVTLSRFSPAAIDEASRPASLPITLVSGEQLLDAFLSRGVGIRTHPIELKVVFESNDIDEDFFLRLRDEA